MNRLFHVATEQEIKRGETTDVYFVRTNEILRREGLADQRVVAEVTTNLLPREWEWAVLAGIEEVAHLLDGVPVNVAGIPEGTIFQPRDQNGLRVPVITLEGRYVDFSSFETPLLGFLCHASGMATMAARIRKAAGKDRTLLSFGVRRAHPALAPMIDRASYIGGFDSVSSLIGARQLGLKATGTMPHSLIVTMRDQVKAWKAFDHYMPRNVPRIALVDTYYDEKTETVLAAETLGDHLDGVRLDTPSSRRGDFAEIIREVRWELDARGYGKVKIFVSGGLNEATVAIYAKAGSDGFGVGSAVSNAPAVDFAMDIVEIDGQPVAKRGKLGLEKKVWRCEQCLSIRVTRKNEHRAPSCGKGHGKMDLLDRQIIRNGKAAKELPSARQIRSYLLKQLDRVGIESVQV